MSNQHSTQTNSSAQTDSDEELYEKLKDLVVEKQQTAQHIADLNNQIQKLEGDQRAKS